MTKKFFLYAIAALGTLQSAAAQPRLIVQIVVGSMRGEDLDRYAENFGEGGFRRLTEGGTVYADDLVHPAPQAVAYIWEKFAGTVLTDRARKLLPEVEAVVAAAAHRPRNPQGEAHRAFCRRQLERIAALPEVDFQSEAAGFRRCIEINS